MSDTLQPRHYTPTPAVRQAVQEAQHMLAYGVESRLELDDEVITSLVTAKNVLRQDAWTPDEEIAFWKACTRLNATVKPVTMRSLKCVVPEPTSPPYLRVFTRANVFLLYYRLLTAAILLALVSMLVYWFVGNHLVQEIAAHTKRKTEIIQVQRAAQAQHTLQEASSPTPPTTLVKARAELEKIDTYLQAEYLGLSEWSTYWQRLIFIKTIEGKNVLLNDKLVQEEISRLHRKINTDEELLGTAEDDQKPIITARIAEQKQTQRRLEKELQAERNTYQRVITHLPAEFVLEVLQSYILPMLFGLLGAAIYVLNSFTKEIDQVTYTMGADVRYLLRLALGALGGLAIGWFLVPEQMSGYVQVLSPLTISLLVGYNIELLFSVMDSFIDAVVKKNG